MHTLRIRIDGRTGPSYPVQAVVLDGPTTVFAAAAAVPAAALPVLDAPLGTAHLDPSALEQFGQRLLDVIRPPELRGAWGAAGPSARIVLDPVPAALRDLPWELLYDGDRQEWLSVNDARPIVRAAPASTVETAVPRELPVRMLVVVGAPEDEDRQRLGVDRELAAIVAAVRDLHCLWQVDVLDGANEEDVCQRMAEYAPHVLHFIGHGTVDAAGRPALEIARLGQEPRALAPQFVVNALGDAPMPRLVVLNACRTAQGGPLPAATVAGLTDAFFDKGSVAAVSVQGDVEARAAVRMSSALYSELAAGRPVDVAVARVRRDLWTGGLRTGDWALPTLTVRGDPDDVLESDALTAVPDLLRSSAGTFPELRWLVDRTVDRRRILVRVAPEVGGRSPSAREGHLTFLTSDEQVGKSTVARSCVLVAWQRGLPVVHVELPEYESVDCPGLFARVAEAVPAALGTADAGARAEAFLVALESPGPVPAPGWAHTASGRAARAPLPPMPLTLGPSMPGRAGEPLTGHRFRPRPATVEELAFARFRDFLTAVAGGGPLLLVLDNVGEMSRDDLLLLREHLFVPAAAGRLAPVRLLVVERPGALRVVVGDERLDGLVVGLEPFRKRDLARLIDEFCTRREFEYRDAHPTARAALPGQMRSLGETVMVGADATLRPGALLGWEAVIREQWSRP